MASPSDSDSNFLLYPELMSKNDLISVLKQRYIKTDTLEFQDKDELVELYNKYILPLPQRKYKKNRRGREMTKKQILVSKKRRHTTDSTEEQPEIKKKSTGKLLTSFDLPSGEGDRLKPPPSCINTTRKTIKLSSSNKSDTQTVSSTLDKLHINNHSPTSSTKKIKLTNTSHTQSSTDIEMVPVESTQNGEIEKKEVSPKTSKIKKISWP
ncbi:hypothetical protein ACF0H5_008565 [Mactra antiquata]